MLCWS